MAIVTDVSGSSPFYGLLERGDELLCINGEPISDLLDYMYMTPDEPTETTFTVMRRGQRMDVSAECDGDFGIEYDRFLMDRERSCSNNCIFCFISQMPKGMRHTLYYKDDDFRLGLIYGNYITLTNVSDADLERIIRLKISPLNISVHTTDPQLRVFMLKNPRAALINEQLARLCAAGINMRCQIVLCRGVNDGAALERTLEDLQKLYPAVSSVSIVPVGLTRFRDGLYPLQPFDKESACAALDTVLRYGDACVKNLGTRLFYPADEFYIKAERDYPPYEFYEEFEQYENGVGMVSSYRHDLDLALSMVRPDPRPRRVCVVTGQAAAPFMRECMQKLRRRFTSMEYEVCEIKNDFFGPNITVTGLLTGHDLINQLSGRELGKSILIPSAMLRDDMFLDDVRVQDVQEALGVRCIVTDSNSAESLILAAEECLI